MLALLGIVMDLWQDCDHSGNALNSHVGLEPFGSLGVEWKCYITIIIIIIIIIII